MCHTMPFSARALKENIFVVVDIVVKNKSKCGFSWYVLLSIMISESTTFWPLWWRVSLSIKLYTTLNHFRFVFYHNNIKETAPTRIWKCTRCIMQMSCLYASDSQKLLQTRLICRNNSKKIGKREKSDDTYSLSIRVHTTKNHISIYFLPQYQRQRKCFFSERELKKALRDTLTRAAW